MKLHLSLRSKPLVELLCFMALCALTPSWSFAIPEDTPLVEVHFPQDQLASYKNRREDHGAYFGIQYEVLKFKNYMSPIDNLMYSEVFGESEIPLMRANIDYKYNFSLGSIALGVDFGTGSVEGGDRKLEVTKYGINAQYALDNIANEPYVVPYLGLNVWNINFSETSPTESFSGTTQMGFNYMIGALIQLNWLDYDTAKNASFTMGLENTYLDVYITQYMTTESPDDPNTETDFSYGAGLRLEF